VSETNENNKEVGWNSIPHSVEIASKSVEKLADHSIELSKFIQNLTKEPLESISGIVNDRLIFWRFKNQLSIMKKTKDILSDPEYKNFKTAIPLKIAIPFLSEASLEDDDDLQNLWARLIANGTQMNVKRIYGDILNRISAYEANILQRIILADHDMINPVVTYNLPNSATQVEGGLSEYSDPSDDVKNALMNLDQLGCIRVGRNLGGGEIYKFVNTTYLGRQFIMFCTKPKGK
jgi:hypothetical protein